MLSVVAQVFVVGMMFFLILSGITSFLFHRSSFQYSPCERLSLLFLILAAACGVVVIPLIGLILYY